MNGKLLHMVFQPTRGFMGSVLLVLLCALSTVRAGMFGTSGLLYAPGAEVTLFEAVADESADSARIRWQTSFETGVQSFRITRQVADGPVEPVGRVHAHGYEAGGIYDLADPSVRRGDSVRYELFLVTAYDEHMVAAWDGVVEASPAVPESMPATAAEGAAESLPVSSNKCWIGNVDRVTVWTNSTPADRIRFSLTEEGVYKVTAQEIADAGGWDYDAVTNALTTTNFAMSCQGEVIAWHPLDDELIFCGVEPESRWAPENVYWIEFGPGLNMAHIDGTPPLNGTTNQWFMDDLFVQGTDMTYQPTYRSLADTAPFLAHSYLLSGSSQQETQELPGYAPGEWAGAVTVNLHSWYLFETGTADTHTGRVSIGTANVGEPAWADEQYVSVSYPFSSTNLSDGSATLTVENIAADPGYPVDYTRFFWISYGFSYARLYQADGGTLRCSGGTGDTVSVVGFATNDLVVLDINATNMPAMIESADIAYDGVSSNWSVAFACGNTGAIYQVCSQSEGFRLPAVRGVRDTDWTAASNAVDYAILIPPEGWMEGFRAPMQELADYRNAQGLLTEVIDVESLYNSFSHGLVDPAAIEAFCVAGISNWTARPLRYLLLAADGSIDFKHDLFTAGDEQGWFIPTRIAGQRFSGGEGMITALDAAMGDVDDDGIPDVAVGRLPTGLTQEVATVVQKTIGYEAALLRTNGSLSKAYAAVAPDYNQAPGSSTYYNFDLACDRLIAPLESAGRIHIPCRAPTNDPADLTYVRNNILFPALQEGCGLFHFFGHSNKRKLGYSDYVLYYTNITPATWTSPVIAVVMGCNPNVWHWLSSSATILPYGLFAENTGFVASLGAAGFLLGDESEELAVHLYTEAAQEGLLRLGDVYLAGVRGTIENPLNPNRLPLPERDQFIGRMQCLSLIGDPALVIRHDITAMGTDVEWLVEYGQTNANADLDDPEGDGWATWREYLDDTDPTDNVLRVTGAGTDTNGMPILSFETASTNVYEVEYKPELTSTGSWQAVAWSENGVDWNPADTNIVPAGPVATVMLPESTIATQGFFRVRTAN